MKKEKVLTSFPLALSLLLFTFSADACTGMYAGKGVTIDGSVLIGRTVDFSPYNATMYQQICEARTQVAFNGVTNKYRYVCAPKSTSLKAGRYAGSAANEKGVILTGTITGATRVDALRTDPFVPEVNGGVGEPYLPDYLIGNAATAREAVKLLGDAVAEHGHAGAEIYMVADTNEAWYIEVYTGHDWAAVKMPEDKVAVFGNHFNLRGVDIESDPDVILSPNLVNRAVNEGFVVWTDETRTKLDLYKTFADPKATEENYANFRAWYGHRRFAPSDDIAYATNLVPVLFYEPDYRIAPTNMFELMRARYEDMTDEMLPTARTNFPIRVIGTTKQGNCHVLQLDCRATMPDNMRGTVWSCLGQAEHGVFIPVNASQDVLSDAFANDAQRTFGYDPNRAADAFRRLSALAQSDRVNRGQGVRDYWRAREARRAVEWPRLVDEAVRTKNTQKLSDYTFYEEERSFAAAKRLYDDLIWYMAANNRISGDGSGATDVPEAPFKPVLRKRFAGEHLTEFGGVRLKTDVGAFLKSGFAFGDTVDIRFSNGAAISGLPVYDGYYAKVDERLVVCQNDEICIQRKFGADLFKEQGLQEPFDVEIVLHQAGGRLAVQTALALTYSDERGDYASDAVFANFRALSGGEVAANLLYRGASPCDNLHKRVFYVNELAKGAGIDCFVDLADTSEKIQAYWNDENVFAPYWKACVRDGKVHSHALGANFRADAYRSGIVAALRTIKNHDFGGRCYIHGQEGKDRTGFLCILIESLGGATLEDIERDYMQSFVNYYGLDKTRDADRYQKVRDVYFGGIVASLANRPLEEVTRENLLVGVENYLHNGGMEEAEISALTSRIKGIEER